MAGQSLGPGSQSMAANLLRCAAQYMAAAAAFLQQPRQPIRGLTPEASAQLRLKVSTAACLAYTWRHLNQYDCHGRIMATISCRPNNTASRSEYVNRCARRSDAPASDSPVRPSLALRHLTTCIAACTGVGTRPAPAAHSSSHPPPASRATSRRTSARCRAKATAASPSVRAGVARPADGSAGGACRRGDTVAA